MRFSGAILRNMSPVMSTQSRAQDDLMTRLNSSWLRQNWHSTVSTKKQTHSRTWFETSLTSLKQSLKHHETSPNNIRTEYVNLRKKKKKEKRKKHKNMKVPRGAGVPDSCLKISILVGKTMFKKKERGKHNILRCAWRGGTRIRSAERELKSAKMWWRSTNVKSCCPCLPKESPSSFGRDAWCRSHTAKVGFRALLAMVRRPGHRQVLEQRRDEGKRQIHYNRSGSSAWSPQASKRVPVTGLPACRCQSRRQQRLRRAEHQCCCVLVLRSGKLQGW